MECSVHGRLVGHRRNLHLFHCTNRNVLQQRNAEVRVEKGNKVVERRFSDASRLAVSEGAVLPSGA